MSNGRRPSDSDRRNAVERLRGEWKKHLERKGVQPTSREVERFVNNACEQADKKNKW